MAKKKAAKKLPRQKTLPGMQDRQVLVLERAALRYADIRDERMGWTKKEVEAKKRVKDLMHDQKRTRYSRGNIEIELVPEDEHVHVRVRDREQPEGEPVDHPPIEEPESPDEVEEPEEVPDAQYVDPEVDKKDEF